MCYNIMRHYSFCSRNTLFHRRTPNMTRRIIALILCVLICASVFVGCSGKIDPQSEYKGQQVIMYLTESIYNLDPAYAYLNDATRSIVGLLFDTLFTLDKDGKLQGALAKSYRTEEVEEDGVTKYYMYIDIKEDAYWSDNVPVTADDVVYAWKRLLNPNNSYDAAYLLFDIKNARAYNQADVSKDDIGLFADDKLLTIEFEGKIDHDHFLKNLCSLALAPLREDIASKNADWTKKSSNAAYSGPFKLSRTSFTVNGKTTYSDLYYSVKMVDENNKVIKDKNGNDMYTNATEPGTFKEQTLNSFVLERNMYYYRNADKDDKLDKSVTPYRILVDCSLSAEDVKRGYDEGIILYVGDIPMSIRGDFKDTASVKDSLSTTSLYFNFDADIDAGSIVTENDGVLAEEPQLEKLFKNVQVRRALSMVIDREKIAADLVFAKVATGLVPAGMADASNVKVAFRDNAKNDYEYLTRNTEAAAKLLSDAGINAKDYSFSISVPAYDEDLVYVADEVCKAWCALGFNVTVKKVGTVANNDLHKDVSSIPTDLCDDLFDEAFRRGDFEVALVDLVAPSTDAMSVLAPFALGFSGQAMDMSDSANYKLNPHITGYNDADYNYLVEQAYNEKDIAARSEYLHRAEEMLMEDMPVIPVVFNQSASLINDQLSLNNTFLFWETSSSYYPVPTFNKMSIPDNEYGEYELDCAKYIYENYDRWVADPMSYFGAVFGNFTKEEFVYTNSNFFYLFKEKCVSSIQKVRDENGKYVYETDAEGNLVVETDKNGNPKVDKDGNPKYVVAEKLVTTYTEGYEWMPVNPKYAPEETEKETTKETTEKVTETETEAENTESGTDTSTETAPSEQ